MKPFFPWASLALALFLTLSTPIRADVIVSTGYDDGNGPPAPPNPWFGSPNTTFFGNSSDLGSAPTSDPDISGVLFQNTSTTPFTISDVKITSFDLFTRAGITSPLTLNPGQNFIFAVGDGSDTLPADQVVSFTINGQAFSFPDTITAAQPDGVLLGNIPFINGVETVPWTPLADLFKPTAPPATVPEPSSLALLTLGGIALASWRRWRKRTR